MKQDRTLRKLILYLRKVSCILILLFVVIIMVSCQSNDCELYTNVVAHMEAGEENYITLAELTDFEWDNALVFEMFSDRPEHRQAIQDAIGIDFPDTLDMTSAIMFVKDDELVHYEIFDLNFDQQPRFFIYTLHHDDTDTRRLRTFTQEDIFEVGRSLSNQHGYRYWLRPSNPRDLGN